MLKNMFSDYALTKEVNERTHEAAPGGCLCEQQTDGHEETEKKNVARGEAQRAVQGASAADLHHLAPGEKMGQHVEQGEQGHPRMAVEGREGRADVAHDALRKIEPATEGLAQRHDERALAGGAVGVAVAVVVDDEQRVDHQTAGRRQPPRRGRERTGLDVVGAEHGNEAEEQPDKHVTQSAIAQQRSVKKSKDHAGCPHEHEPPPAVEQEEAAREAGQHQHRGDGTPHGRGRDPSLSTGPLGAQAVFAVGAFAEVEQVVDEVGRHLHEGGKQEAQHDGHRAEAPLGPCQCRGHDHRHKRSRKRLGARRQKPRPQGILLHCCFLHT